MIGRIAVAALVGAVVHFAWGFTAHVLLPYHNAVMGEFQDEERTRLTIGQLGMEPGIYMYPTEGMSFDASTDAEKAAHAEWERKANEGPVGILIHRDRVDPRSPQPYLGGFALCLAYSLLVAAMSAAAIPHLKRCITKILFVAGFGAFACLYAWLVEWNWMWFPLEYALAQCFDAIVGWTLVGMVFSKLLDRKPVVAAA